MEPNVMAAVRDMLTSRKVLCLAALIDGEPAASRVFIARLPSSEMTLGFGDFTLYRLRLGHGRFVAGFAQACNIGPDTFQEMARVG
jgi:hypothetical protein